MKTPKRRKSAFNTSMRPLPKKIKKVKKGACVHHWMIAKAKVNKDGSLAKRSRGRCRKCKQTKMFSNYI